MSTNKTENLNLHSWVAEDRVRMEEFNENWAAIDEAVGDANEAILATASDVAAEIAARESAVTALQSAVAALGNCLIEFGSYTGAGGTTRTLTFSFPPDLLFIQMAGDKARAWSVCAAGNLLLWNQANGYSDKITSVWGNNVMLTHNSVDTVYLDTKNKTYHYIAIGRKVK